MLDARCRMLNTGFLVHEVRRIAIGLEWTTEQIRHESPASIEHPETSIQHLASCVHAWDNHRFQPVRFLVDSQRGAGKASHSIACFYGITTNRRLVRWGARRRLGHRDTWLGLAAKAAHENSGA